MRETISIYIAVLVAVVNCGIASAVGIDGAWEKMMREQDGVFRQDVSMALGIDLNLYGNTAPEPYSFFPSMPVESIPDVAGAFSSGFSSKLEFAKAVSRIELVSFNYSNKRLADTLSMINKPLDEQYRILLMWMRYGDVPTSAEDTGDEPERD